MPLDLGQLRVPVVAAPMLIVCGPELVIAACRAGVIGSFPIANPRGEGELEHWLTTIETALARLREDGEDPAPFVPNLIVHKTNPRLDAAQSGQPGAGPRRYRDIWSAGHSASGVRDVPTVAAVVDRLAGEYEQARAATAARLEGTQA